MMPPSVKYSRLMKNYYWDHFSKTTSAGAIMHSAMNGQPEPGLGMGMGGPRGGPGPAPSSMRMDGPHAPPQAGGPPPQVLIVHVMKCYDVLKCLKYM